MCFSLLGINLLTMVFFSNMIITIIIIVIITSGGGGGGEVAREALKVYKTDIMQLTGVLSPFQFMSTSTLAVERLVLAGRILPSFYVGNSILLAR